MNDEQWNMYVYISYTEILTQVIGIGGNVTEHTMCSQKDVSLMVLKEIYWQTTTTYILHFVSKSAHSWGI